MRYIERFCGVMLAFFALESILSVFNTVLGDGRFTHVLWLIRLVWFLVFGLFVWRGVVNYRNGNFFLED